MIGFVASCSARSPPTGRLGEATRVRSRRLSPRRADRAPGATGDIPAVMTASLPPVNRADPPRSKRCRRRRTDRSGCPARCRCRGRCGGSRYVSPRRRRGRGRNRRKLRKSRRKSPHPSAASRPPRLSPAIRMWPRRRGCLPFSATNPVQPTATRARRPPPPLLLTRGRPVCPWMAGSIRRCFPACAAM